MAHKGVNFGAELDRILEEESVASIGVDAEPGVKSDGVERHLGHGARGRPGGASDAELRELARTTGESRAAG